MHTDLENPGAYLIGGTPVVLVESNPGRPVQPARNLSPAALPPFRPVAARVAGQPGSGALPGEAAAPVLGTASGRTGAADYAIPTGHFFTQANGQGGQGGSGYALVDDEQARAWTDFQRAGGVDALGYPSSRRYQSGGLLYQATQRALLQWQPDGLHFANVFDLLAAAGKDDWLQAAHQIPKSESWDGDGGKPWPEVVASHLALLDRAPAIQARYFAEPAYLDSYGLPMAVADQGTALVVRCQRAAFQEWKQDVPWAAAGQVTVALGGDIAKEAGLVPPEAQRPQSDV
jgi:hypothetical protein